MPYNTGDTLPPIVVRGASLTKDVRDKVNSLTVSMTTGQITELTIAVSDEDLLLFQKGLFTKKAPVTIQDLNLLIANYDVGGGNSGRGAITLNLQPRVVIALQDLKGANVLSNISPSTYVQIGAKKAGAGAVVQDTKSRAQVARDVTIAGQGGTSDNNEWTTFDRLAQEEGFMLFEALGVVYFGKPSWLVGKLPLVRVSWSPTPQKNTNQCIGIPSCSEDAKTGQKTVTLDLPLSRSREVTTGKALQLDGMPQFSGRYLISSVEYPAAGAGMVSVSAESPLDPDPQPADKEK